MEGGGGAWERRREGVDVASRRRMSWQSSGEKETFK
jgi:hypothetical protein